VARLFSAPPPTARWQPLTTEAFGKGLRVFRLNKAEHHEVGVIANREYVSGVADRAAAAQNITLEAPRDAAICA
jgi:hypothetical protein